MPLNTSWPVKASTQRTPTPTRLRSVGGGGGGVDGGVDGGVGGGVGGGGGGGNDDDALRHFSEI